jgi:hypothetical protein
MRRLALALLLSALVISCGGDDGDGGPTGPQNADIAGTWDALITVTGGTQGPVGTRFTAVINVSQADANLGGSWSAPSGSGPFIGSIAGRAVEFTLQQDVPCPGSFSGTGTVAASGEQIDGTYSGSFCAGTIDASFSAFRRSVATTGSLDVSATTTGTNLDPDGYIATVDGSQSLSININGTVTFSNLNSGVHVVQLSGVASGCVVLGDNPRSVAVTGGGTAQTTFTVQCQPLPSGGFALSFDGLQQSATTPDASELDLRSSWTLEAWIRPTDPNGGRQDIVSKWGPVGPLAAYVVWLEAGRITAGTHDGATTTLQTGNAALVSDTWRHIAVTFQSGTLRIYVNGNLDLEAPNLATPQNGTAPLSLGNQDRREFFYEGTLDEVRIWNVHRSQNQITASMNVQIDPRSAGLVAYWRMDEGTGDIAFDLTGNGHSMQLGDAVGADAGDPVWVTPGKP